MKLILSILLLISAVSFGSDQLDLIGGTPAKEGEYPASVYARMSGSRCSATVVGERILFIAAHCVRDGGIAEFTVGANNYRSKCKHSPDYNLAAWEIHKQAIEKDQTPFVEERNSTADWALCLVDKVVSGIEYEMVNQDPQRHKVGDKLMLTGYGCIRPGGGGGNDGIYRVGEAPIIRLPSGSSNDIVTKGKAALCYGDSGGPAFFYEGTKRWLVSINSRGNISNTSYLSSTSTAQAKEFIADWLFENKVEMCGVSPQAKNCRGGEPPKPNKVELENSVAKGSIELKPGYEGLLDKAKSLLSELMDKLN